MAGRVRRVPLRRRRELRRGNDVPAAERDVQAPWEGRHNYHLNSAVVLRDVYRLLTLALADEAIAQIAAGEHDELTQLRDQFVEDELVHLLISTAVMNRSQDDHMRGPRGDAAEMSFNPVNVTCGTWVRNMSLETVAEIPLTLREACNKIIHATRIEAETEEIEGHAYRVMPSTVRLRGMQGATPWQALLHIPDYARATVQNFR